MSRKQVQMKQMGNEIRNKVVKIRVNDTEFNQFDEASREIDMEKTQIVREAIKEYLAKKDIEIWN